jgi:hypothetical protein
MLPAYIPITVEELWPLQLSLMNQPNLTSADCGVLSTDQGCPNAGYEAVQLWAESYVSNLSPAEINMADQFSNSQRILSAEIPGYADSIGEYVAISTSPSHFASSAIVSFWNFISEIESLLNFNRPRLRTNPS